MLPLFHDGNLDADCERFTQDYPVTGPYDGSLDPIPFSERMQGFVYACTSRETRLTERGIAYPSFDWTALSVDQNEGYPRLWLRRVRRLLEDRAVALQRVLDAHR